MKIATFEGLEVSFSVSFKFSRLSHKTNKIASLIPMLIIAGFPGFIQKIYTLNHASGFWQGIYHWKSKIHLDEYKRSLVFRMMNKRAVKGTVSSCVLNEKGLQIYLRSSPV